MKNESLKSIDMYCRIDQLSKSGLMYYDSYPINSESKNKSSAIDWASSKGEGKLFVLNNELGFNDLILVDLDVRSQGGRAYKVILSSEGNNFMVDMREESLMHILKTGTVNKGIIKGHFSFIQNGSQIRLTSTDSEEFKRFNENGKVNNSRVKVSDKKLIPNTIYKLGKTKGAYTLYLGKSYVSDVINQFNPDISKFNTGISELGLYVDIFCGDTPNLLNQRVSVDYFKTRSIFSINEGEVSEEFSPDRILSKLPNKIILPKYFIRYSLGSEVNLTAFLELYKNKLKSAGSSIFSKTTKRNEIGLEMNEMYNRLVEKYGR
jgi:hypothetical protein